MSSLGSFWFSCSSPLFHAALLSNSSGPVTRVLRLSLSLFSSLYHSLWSVFYLLSSLSLACSAFFDFPLLSAIYLFVYLLPLFPLSHFPFSVLLHLKNLKWGTAGERVREKERGRERKGACMNGHYCPIPFIPVSEGTCPRKLHLTTTTSTGLCEAKGPELL